MKDENALGVFINKTTLIQNFLFFACNCGVTVPRLVKQGTPTELNETMRELMFFQAFAVSIQAFEVRFHLVATVENIPT